MNIRFVSSLTPDDEDRLAPGLVHALGQLLDAVPIAYTLRVETATGRVFQHAHAARDVLAPPPVSPPEPLAGDTALQESANYREKTSTG